MHRLTMVCGVCCAMAATVGLQAPGLAAWGGEQSVLYSLTVAAGPAHCTFPVQVTAIGQPQSSRELADGMIGTGGGAQTVYTNLATGTTVSFTEAGAIRFVTTSDGSLQLVEFHGAVTLIGQTRFGLPGIANNLGDVVAVIGDDGRTASETLQGQLVDVCAALS